MIPTKILIVEDDVAAAKGLSRILERLGYQVPAILHHGDDAERMARHSAAELALLNVRLLEDGTAAFGGRLRRSLPIPIVYVGSSSDRSAFERVMTSDPYGYLERPFRDDELRSVVEIALRRRRTERRLASERKRLAAALQSIGDAVVVVDPAGRVDFLNPAAERLAGWSSEEVRGRHVECVLRFVDRESGARLSDPCAEALRSGEVRPFDPRGALALRGTPMPVAGSAAPVLADEGELLGVIVAFRPVGPGTIDSAGVGGRKFREDFSSASSASTEVEGEAPHTETGQGAGGADEGRYSRIFQTSPAAMTLSSLEDGRVLEVNEAFSHLSGWQPEEAVGTSLVELGWWVSPHDRLWLDEAVREAFVEDVEVTFCTRTGDLKETLVSAERMDIDGEACLLMAIHDITERKELERELHRNALHDPLTGLPNRTLFRDRLDHALDRVQRRGTRVAVLFLDLDGFKEVNDGLGHARGDELLRALAERVRGCVRDGDTFARFGGDEFAAVLEPIEAIHEVRRVVARFIEALQEPIECDGVRIPIAASIGVAIGGPGHACPEDLVRAADVAMYRAKEDPGTSYRIFDPLFETGERRRRRWPIPTSNRF